MKNRKGFTLIELLAVIVILAIIALIATPIILNMISKARKSAAKDSALGREYCLSFLCQRDVCAAAPCGAQPSEARLLARRSSLDTFCRSADPVERTIILPKPNQAVGISAGPNNADHSGERQQSGIS